jgi:tetratricopeptide (TPR) repeat protein
MISYNNKQNSKALKFFNFAKTLKNKHIPYLENYIKILVQEKKTGAAIKEIKTSLNKKNIDFFEAYLLLFLDALEKKKYEKSKEYLVKISELKENNTFQLIIYESLKNYVYLFENKKRSINKKNFGNLNLINETFENCYLDTNETEKSYIKLLSIADADYSRYKFFYINYLIEKKKETEAKIYVKKIDILKSNLLVSQLKNWIEKDNFESSNEIFSCKNESHILSEFFYLIANLYSSEDMYDESNFYVNISNFLNSYFIYNSTLLAENYILNENYELAKKILNNFKKKDEVYYWYRIKKNTQMLSEEYGDKKAFEYLNLKFKKIKKPSLKILYDVANLTKGFDRHKIAINYYDQILSRLNRESIFYSEILYRRGGSYERLGEFEKSDKDLMESLKLDPDDAYVLNYLAYSWLERNYQIDLAIEMLEKAHRKKSDDPYILDSIGWAYYLIGNYFKAEKFLKKAVQLMPNDPVVNDHYGDILWRLDRKMQAKYHWLNVLKLENTEQDMKDKINFKLLKGPKKI